MAVECSRCGECCSHMGMVYQIAEVLGDYGFLVSNLYTGARYEVRIDRDKIQLFERRMPGRAGPEACPFLYLAPEGEESSCTVHQTRPDVCREVFCCRMLITDPGGKRVGRVMGTRHLCTDDARLEELWRSRIRTEDEPDDDGIWEERVVRILTGENYRVRR
ncbi:hypothetical protein J2741_001791 [Methanolinea mesophila]|uniref:YkgJ family cysteine cluster protein n=1 Tax=Methanolinea mesophila TaxID=547055 RepID=UPI001AE6000D|nr:YkgJ family cysteine cluster protein [Methanolinea mesophila]MBP1929244.1 hypothetical protein [Methanolinea mesophila]